MSRTQRVPYGAMLKGNPLGKNATATKAAAKNKPAKTKKLRRK